MSIRFSAFIEDMRLDSLPQNVRDDISRFVTAKDHHLFPHYGMVVKELIGKADPANLKTARAHVRGFPLKKARMAVIEATQSGSKYILMLNDRIIDGHHFLAKAERAGVSSSLNVLDLTPARFQFAANSDQPVRRSKLRTAAMLAGGGGLLYGGIQVGRAANRVRSVVPVIGETARKIGVAADHTGAVAGGVRSALTPLAKMKRVLGFSSKLTAIAFAAPGVAYDRYRKSIREKDSDRALGNYRNAAVAGSLAGLAMRKPSVSRLKAAGLGAAAGIGAQAIVRAGTAQTKDQFGDRSPGGRKVDAIAPLAIGGAALIAGRRKLAALPRFAKGKANAAIGKTRRKATAAFPGMAADLIRNTVLGFSEPVAFAAMADRLRRARITRAITHGGALAGGITIADIATSAAMPEKKQTIGEAAAHGLKKGALYGGALAVSEPLIHKVLVATARRAGRQGFSARPQAIAFGGRQQLRDSGNRFIDPLDVASGTHDAYAGDRRVELPVQHAQVVRAALNKGRVLHRYGSRTGSLLRDATDAAAGRAKVDSRGRAVKREWEKSWFKNALGSAAIAGGLLGHAALMRRNPKYRLKVQKAVSSGKTTANRIVPDLFPMSVPTIDVHATVMRFDQSAPDWDVRDQRGRSARVFAPGARPRDRRDKKWHERVGNIRLVGIVGALGAGALGAGLGYRLGRSRAVTMKPRQIPGAVIPFPKAS